MKLGKLSKLPDLASEAVDDQYLVLDPRSNTFFQLNQVGGRIWELLDEASDDANIEAIALTISQEFEVDIQQALQDVHEYLNQLFEAGLLVRMG